MNNTLLTDPPKFKELSKNDRLYVIYNEVVRHIETLRQSGRLKEGQDLNAEAITTQIILESGWADSSLSNRTNNFGGLTAGSAWKGKIDTVENDPITGGTYNYRVFDTPLEGIRAQVEFYLPDVNSRYAKAGVLKAKTPEEHFAAVQRAGYAEDPKYVSKNTHMLKSTIRPRLARSTEANEAIDAWYAQIEDHKLEKNFSQELDNNQVAETRNSNKALEQQFKKTRQQMAAYTAQTANNLNLISKKQTAAVPTSEYLTPQGAQSIEGSLTQLPSQEVVKAEATRQAAELKKQEAFNKAIYSPVTSGNMQDPIFGQGYLFGQNKKKNGGYINQSNYPRYLENGGPGDKELKDKENNLNGRVGPEINPTHSFGQTPRRLGYTSGYGKKYSFSPDSKQIDNFVDPISFNVDAETGNKKIYNPKTGKFEVTDTPYEDKGEYGVSMMSHRADRYEDDDMSSEAKAARIEKAEEMLKYSQIKGNRAMQQFADRSDYSAKEGLGLQEQGVSPRYWNSYKDQFQCISGSSSNCSPIPGMPMDQNQPNYATVPHFNKNRKGDLILNTQKTAGTQKGGESITGPGDNIPNMGGNETFASWGTMNYGFEMTPPQSPLKEGQILVHKAYDDWRSKLEGVENPPYKNTFQYGRVKNFGSPYHAQTVGNIGKESLHGIEKEGFKIGQNPGHGRYQLADVKPVDENVPRHMAQFNWVYDNPYYKAVLANMQKRNNLSKKD